LLVTEDRGEIEVWIESASAGDADRTRNEGPNPRIPPLPEEWISKTQRAATFENDWMRAWTRDPAIIALDRLGVANSKLDGILDWMDWERRKAHRPLWTGS
jgi:hypothetical protein